jgi:6-phosphofructokinase 2
MNTPNPQTAAIVTFTPNPAIDVSTSVERVEPERKLRCDEPRREPGGGGLNVARAITRLGGAALALWAKGGATGSMLHVLLDREGVPHQPIQIDGLVRESFAVFERSSGRQFRFSTPGPSLPENGLQRLIDELARMAPLPALVVDSGSLPPGTDEHLYAQAAEVVASRGGRLVLDTAGRALRLALETRCVSLIKPNPRELSLLVEKELRSPAALADAARAIVAAGLCQVVLISLGASGALVVDADVTDLINAPAVPVRSTVGAGDCTVAGMVLALNRGEPTLRAARFGVAAGAAAVMTPGSELCRRQDVERLFAAMA